MGTSLNYFHFYRLFSASNLEMKVFSSISNKNIILEHPRKATKQNTSFLMKFKEFPLISPNINNKGKERYELLAGLFSKNESVRASTEPKSSRPNFQ